MPASFVAYHKTAITIFYNYIYNILPTTVEEITSQRFFERKLKELSNTRCCFSFVDFVLILSAMFQALACTLFTHFPCFSLSVYVCSKMYHRRSVGCIVTK